MQTINTDGILAMRLLSVSLGLITAGAVYYLVRKWTTRRLALFGIILFCTSSWFVHVVRYGVAIDALYSASIVMLAFAVWLQGTKRRRLLLILVAWCLLYLYIPGFIWIIATAAVWQRKRLWGELKRTSTWFKYGYPFLLLAIIAPLIAGVVRDPKTIVALAGLPDNFSGWSDIVANGLALPRTILFSGINDQAIWLPETPLLSIFSIVMLVLGLYWCAYMWRLDRSRALIGSLFFWSLLIISGGPVREAVLLPYTFIVITLGIGLMLQQWFTVFPKNGVARATALTLICLAVTLTVVYNVNHYFVAWSQAPETRTEFSIQGVPSGTIRDE